MRRHAGWLLAAALLWSPALAQQRPDELASALQRAARAGDSAAYRQLLAPSGTFAVEGANFAADLALHPAPDVTYTLSAVRETGDTAQAQLNLAWTRRPAGGEAEPVRVSLPVRLQRQSGLWRYAGEALRPLPAGQGTLLALDVPGLPERTAVLGPLLGLAAGEVRRVLGLAVPGDAVVKVYPDHARLSASVGLSLQPVAGWNEPGEAIKIVLPSGAPMEVERAALRVLAHEYTHLAVGHTLGPAGNGRVPWWLHEGLANFVASAYLTAARQAEWRAAVRGYARTDWAPLADLADYPTVPEYRWDHAYRQGLGVVQFLAQTRGPDRPWRLAAALGARNTPDAAAKQLDFTSFAALEAAARAWLAGP